MPPRGFPPAVCWDLVFHLPRLREPEATIYLTSSLTWTLLGLVTTVITGLLVTMDTTATMAIVVVAVAITTKKNVSQYDTQI